MVLFIYMNLRGDVAVEESSDAEMFDNDPLWQHIATIEPKSYLRKTLNKNAKLVAEFRKAEDGSWPIRALYTAPPTAKVEQELADAFVLLWSSDDRAAWDKKAVEHFDSLLAKVESGGYLAPPTAIPEGWRPITTAPKDRRIILGFSKQLFTGVTAAFGRWEDDRYANNPRPYWSHELENLTGIRGARSNQPTCWMEVPTSPEGEKK